MYRQIIEKYDIAYENILNLLLDLAKKDPGKSMCHFNQTDIEKLCDASVEIIGAQPLMLELNPPVNVIGDIHGQFYDLVRIFQTIGWPNSQPYVLQGNYVNFGNYGIETMVFLLVMKLKFPDTFFLLRGNHECDKLTKVHGFYQECKKRYGSVVWKKFVEVFNCLPIASIVGDSIFQVHSGISEKLVEVVDIYNFPRNEPIDTTTKDKKVICDLLWSDPNLEEDKDEFFENPRGLGVLYPKACLQQFLKDNKLRMMVKGNQIVQEGFEILWDGMLVNLWSAPNFANDYDNKGAVMLINEELKYKFVQFVSYGIDPRWEEQERYELEQKKKEEQKRKEEEERIAAMKKVSAKKSRLNRVSALRNEMVKDPSQRSINNSGLGYSTGKRSNKGPMDEIAEEDN